MSFLPASKIVGGRQPETTNATPFLSVPRPPLLNSGQCASAAAVRNVNRYLVGEPPSGADGEDKIMSDSKRCRPPLPEDAIEHISSQHFAGPSVPSFPTCMVYFYMWTY